MNSGMASVNILTCACASSDTDVVFSSSNGTPVMAAIAAAAVDGRSGIPCAVLGRSLLSGDSFFVVDGNGSFFFLSGDGSGVDFADLKDFENFNLDDGLLLELLTG